MKDSPMRRCWLLAASLLLAGGAAQANTYTLINLGHLLYDANVNDDGTVAGTSGSERALLWNGDHWRKLSKEAGGAHAINAHGDVVGELGADALGRKPVLWQGMQAPRELGLPAGAQLGGLALGVNDVRTVVGHYYVDTNFNSHCFQWTEEAGPVDLGLMKHGLGCRAYAINKQGQITGSAYKRGFRYQQAFRYEAGVFEDLGSLEGGRSVEVFSRGLAINSHGDVAGLSRAEKFKQQDRYHAILWRGSKLIDLDPEGTYTYTVANGINDHGDIVGESRLGSYYAAVRFTNPGIVPLEAEVNNLGRWRLLRATGVNQRGDIVVWARGPAGEERTVLLKLESRD